MIKYEFNFYSTSLSEEEVKKAFEYKKDFNRDDGFCDLEAKYISRKSETTKKKINGVKQKVTTEFTEATVICYVDEDLEPSDVEGLIYIWLESKGFDKNFSDEFLWKES